MYWNRVVEWPHSLKLFIICSSLVVMMSMSAASKQPSSSKIVWITALLSVILECAATLIIALDLDDVLVLRRWPQLSWAINEIVKSVAITVLYFISIFVCIGATLFGSVTAFGMAGFFCIVTTILSMANVVVFLRRWMAENRFAEGISTVKPGFMNPPSYGGP
uniref:MARVEL domain-containing protein n=1 Tax=Panagrellus redivivus TaxID=6233 RepID=A0A7E4UMG1_PANRE